MEPQTKISITDINADGTISVLLQTYLMYNGQEMTLSNHREALMPGEFSRAKEILPDNQYSALVVLWTPEVVTAWEEKMARLEEPK